MALDVAEESPVDPQLENDAMWQMNHRANGSMEGGPYPERPGEQDCAYYMKTGVCRFGMTCRYNHPPSKKLAISAASLKLGSYPERLGQSECQYYLKTGTCKFGAACKFDHPRDKAGIDGSVSLNILGYPLRTNEQECSYYLRTGLCKFGSTCKFHHPQPLSSMPTWVNSPVYSSVNSSTTSGQQSSYLGGDTNYGLSRASFPANPRWQGLSSYAQLLLPQGVVSVPSWNAAYAGQLGSFSTSENQQQTSRSGMFVWQKDNNIFPERPDQPECQFYMKTGDCKFGAFCKFHHPKDRLIPAPNCLLSPLGLPLRPGEPSCSFYSRYGSCKFGPNCKFDHPMGTFTYGLSHSALSDVPIVRRMLGSLPGTAAPPMSISGGKFMRFTPQISSRDEETFDGENSP